MGVAPLSDTELRLGNSGPLNQVLEDNGFLQKTPLWYYVLKEAEVRANGNSLGELGSRIVCETIIGQLLNDPESYLNSRGLGSQQGREAAQRQSHRDHPRLFQVRRFDSLTLVSCEGNTFKKGSFRVF